MTGGAADEGAGRVGGKAGGVVGLGVVGMGTVMVGACARPPLVAERSRPQARRDCRAKRMMLYYNTRKRAGT